MNKPTFAELWAEQQRQIKKGKTAAEALLDIWEMGFKMAIDEMNADNLKKSAPADNISYK